MSRSSPDADKDPASEDKDWAELSAVEQAAAKTLGYEQKTWDA